MGESTQSTRLSNLCFQPLCEEGRPRAQIEQASNLSEEESDLKERLGAVSTLRKSPWLFDQLGALFETVKLSNQKCCQSGPAVDRLGFHISGYINNVICTELGSERRHAVFAIGHLVSDGLLMAFVVVSEISLEIILLERALTINNVAATDMTCSAVGRENLLAMCRVSS